MFFPAASAICLFQVFTKAQTECFGYPSNLFTCLCLIAVTLVYLIWSFVCFSSRGKQMINAMKNGLVQGDSGSYINSSYTFENILLLKINSYCVDLHSIVQPALCWKKISIQGLTKVSFGWKIDTTQSSWLHASSIIYHRFG